MERHPRYESERLSGSPAHRPTVPMPPDLFFSADIETDGPVPGAFSMLSFALVVAGSFDGTRFLPSTSLDDVFTAELKPVTNRFDEEAVRVSGLSREHLAQHGREPGEVMRECGAWVSARANGRTPVLVAYPLGFDWSFLHYYFTIFAGESPFGHSRGFDLKTAVALESGVPVGGAGRSRLPEGLRSDRPHTHKALDDAREQAEILARLFQRRDARRGL